MEAPRSDLRAHLRELLPSAGGQVLEELAGLARVAPFDRHDVLVRAGDRPRLALVLEGHVASRRMDPNGTTRLIALNGPGELAGLTSLALADASELVALTGGSAALWHGEQVLELGRRDAGLATDLLELTLHASARLVTRLDHVSFDSVTQRLARLLWQRRALLFDPERPLLSRPELADLVGATREMTDRAIRSLEGAGVVRRVGPRGLVLVDPDRLHALADVDADERECS